MLCQWQRTATPSRQGRRLAFQQRLYKVRLRVDQPGKITSGASMSGSRLSVACRLAFLQSRHFLPKATGDSAVAISPVRPARRGDDGFRPGEQIAALHCCGPRADGLRNWRSPRAPCDLLVGSSTYHCPFGCVVRGLPKTPPLSGTDAGVHQAKPDRAEDREVLTALRMRGYARLRARPCAPLGASASTPTSRLHSVQPPPGQLVLRDRMRGCPMRPRS